MVGTETPASCESRRQQLLPPPTAGRASPRLYELGVAEPCPNGIEIHVGAHQMSRRGVANHVRLPQIRPRSPLSSSLRLPSLPSASTTLLLPTIDRAAFDEHGIVPVCVRRVRASVDGSGSLPLPARDPVRRVLRRLRRQRRLSARQRPDGQHAVQREPAQAPLLCEQPPARAASVLLDHRETRPGARTHRDQEVDRRTAAGAPPSCSAGCRSCCS